MDALIEKYKDRLPGKGDPGIFDALIEKVGQTAEFTDHEKIKVSAFDSTSRAVNSYMS
jgi:hypothetical protein